MPPRDPQSQSDYTVPPIQPSAQPAPAPVSRPQPRSTRVPVLGKKRWLKRGLIALGVVLVLAGGAFAWKLASDASKLAKGNLIGLLSGTKLAGEDDGRVNILLAGNSADDPGHGGSDLTDSLMILSLNTKTNQAFILSIPRDLWVSIPGHGYHKINTAYTYGGMDTVKAVVQQTFDVKINYYTLVNYTAFRDLVNAVGGIDVTIKSSDARGIYDPNISKADKGPLILKNGLQHLDGQTALNLARARNDPPANGRQIPYGLPRGDYDRAANQRLMLAALQQKMMSSSTWSNPVKISQLSSALGNNVSTNFSTGELRRLYDLSKKINGSAVTSASLTDQNLVKDFTTASGEAAIAPTAGVTDYSKLQLYVRQLMSSDPVVKEGAAVVVLNGSSVTGLAKKEADALMAKGINVDTYDTASKPYATTTIIDNSAGKKAATLAWLKSRYGAGVVVTSNPGVAAAYNTDFIIVLGADRSAK